MAASTICHLPGFLWGSCRSHRLPGAGAAGTRTGGCCAPRYRFPAASHQRRLGERTVSQRLPRYSNHCHLLRPRRRFQPVGIVRGATRQARHIESAVSSVIDANQIEQLPLAGRDVYTMLIALPGVTADAGTSRGLGDSINGQRPSSSNYLLDGLENNNYLITGPLTAESPEMVQEYRVSTNNYSAEYGRTSGFVANAVSRGGSNQFHGIGYWYLKSCRAECQRLPGKSRGDQPPRRQRK